MAQIPGTEGPVSYPNTPEGGAEGGALAGPPLPGGTARYPEPSPANMPTSAMGAGVPGSEGLTPNPGEPTSGSIQKGYKGDSYAAGGSDDLQPPGGGSNEFVTGGPNESTVGALSVPSSFSEPSTDQG